MDALKVYDVKKICDARLCIVDMATAFVRALATVLMMGGVAVLYRYRAVLAALFCTRGRRPARSPPTPRAFGSARRLEARPCPAAALGHRSCPHVEGVLCRRPRAPQPPACRRSALPPAPASFPPLRPCWQSVWLYTYKIAGTKRSRRFTVGVAGFEPTASSSRTKRATKLRHTPVPNEYSHTSSENPNRDRRTMGSVCHAAKMSVR